MSASRTLAVPASYAALRQAVQVAVLRGRELIERSWVQTYHECGRLIHEHVLLKQDRAAYGGQVFNRLAADTGIDKRTLQQTVQFYRLFPIARHGAQLSWAHYRVLIQVEDKTQREALLLQATKHGWTSPELIERVRTLNAAPAETNDPAAKGVVAPPKLLIPRRGTPGICRVAADGESLAVDLGFSVYLTLPPATKLRADNFVTVTAEGMAAAKDATKADLFTYEVELLKVVDADTFWVKIFLRPDEWVKQKLRLRDLDAPEIATPEGKAAKRFVESLVAAATGVTVCTTKPDKYDRYLADVYLGAKAGEPVFLNNALLAAGHAVPKKAWQFGDWEPDLV